jgi:hypothetical protein
MGRGTVSDAPTFRAWCLSTSRTKDIEGRVIGAIADSIATWSRSRPPPIKSASDLRAYLVSINSDRASVAAVDQIWRRYQSSRLTL